MNTFRNGDKTYTLEDIDQLFERVNELEEWVAAISDDHPNIPDWIQHSARSLLVKEQEK